ncbi:von Willebrand factor type A [Limnospira maxima CS-328]|uniref:von Willebrand factor type A n=1 Tax=Limnospira maxima CS-328 TaxID=513049 RepID=B5VZ71_LIMMA|nr:VWA domain-containing protein [Limnospira maxima]EDZ95543.1 von Willebrand factor type A [Limnospira maxima CS-328]MDC0839099.1 VWA domain-containing protein [Limnoraphis robusta]
MITRKSSPWLVGISLIPVLLIASCDDAYNRSLQSPPRELATPRVGETYLDAGLTPATPSPIPLELDAEIPNTETYDLIAENNFQLVAANPLSTFSIDVDTASYSNVRRFINQRQRPPIDAVRIEELINYFSYDYPQPQAEEPFSITTEVSSAPWSPQHQLVHIGLQGKTLAIEELPPSNLVFLLDVSGSMNQPNRLPLLKEGFKLLVDQLTEQDTVAIAVYAGAAGVVLPPTPGNEKQKIIAAIDGLQAQGSTAGGEGIKLAYELATRMLSEGKNNRVILATDGDFNVGVSSDAELVRLIESYRDRGIYLTVLGFGMGNYKDSKMEKLSNHGNGNYAYIDNLMEAKKVMSTELTGTLFTIAKDVKIQVEFNPAQVQAYRLIGYENRRLENQDFHDDTKDAGEIGAGHSVTALYEIIPVGVESDVNLPAVDQLTYQQNVVSSEAYNSNELMRLKIRYKPPTETESRLLEQPIINRSLPLNQTSDNFRFAAAVAEFGMLLRNSPYRGNSSFPQVLQLAESSKGVDLHGYRSEFIQLVKRTPQR